MTVGLYLWFVATNGCKLSSCPNVVIGHPENYQQLSFSGNQKKNEQRILHNDKEKFSIDHSITPGFHIVSR
jgi:hypothetical protein